MNLTIGEFKKFIEDNNLPDEMPMGLWDLSTDDFTDGNYPLSEDQLLIEDYVKEEDGDIQGKMLFITFENNLNEDPLSNLN